MSESKIMSLHDAISKYVTQGSSVVMGTSLESLIPFAAGHEIIRQGIKNLMLVGPISDILFDQVIGGGCVRKIQAAWVGNVITGSGYEFRRAVEQGRITVEDHTNLTMAMAMKAAAMGVPYMPSRTAFGSDLIKTNPNLLESDCPFTGEKICAVRAIQPDVAIVHAQRSDPSGNAHIWGNLGITRDACLASRKVIVTVEEIVSGEVITRDPNRVLVPGFRVDAVVHVPWGGYPSPVPGYYNRDHQAFLDYRSMTRSPSGFDTWRKKWIDENRSHAVAMEKLGSDHQDSLRLNHHSVSEEVDYGY